MIYSSLSEVVQQSAVAAQLVPPQMSGMDGGTREIARRLLAEADQEESAAPLLREAATELLKLAILIGPVPETRLWADYVRTKLGLRHRGSALLLLELIGRPGVPRRARDLAPLICTKSVNTSSVKVFVHELRTALGGVGIDNAIMLRSREGYYVDEEAVPQLMGLLQ
jgi:hypothetical protein